MKQIRKFALTALMTLGMTSATCAFARFSSPQPTGNDSKEKISLWENARQHNVLNHLDLGLTLGTGGVGIELASPVTDWARVRAGVNFVPRFNVPMNFDIESFTEDGNISATNFDKVQQLINDLTGFEMDRTISMTGKPYEVDFKFLIDITPIRTNRNWHFTVGFYAGSRKLATAVNNKEEMPSLLCMGLYNKLYDYVKSGDYLENPILDLGGNGGEIWLEPAVAQKILEKGRLGIHLGDYKDTGKPYLMEPDKDGMVKATAFINAFKPYVGIGYNGSPKKAPRLNIGFDAGALFWGGAPNIVTHEGVSMSRDLTNIPGRPGDYVRFLNKLSVYPMVNFKISYTLF